MNPTESIAEGNENQIVIDWLARMKAPPRAPGSQPDRDLEVERLDPDPTLPPLDLAEVPGVLNDPGVDCEDDLDDGDLAAVTSSRWLQACLIGALLGAGLGLALFLSWHDPEPAQAAALTDPDLVTPASPDLPPPVQAVVSQPALTRLEAPAQEADPNPGAPATQVHPARPSAGHHLAAGSWQVERKRPKAMAVKYRRLLRRGWRAYGRGDFATATNAFARAVHIWPDRTGGYFGMALSLFEQGAEDGAMQVLERGVKKVGPKTDLWVLAGSIYQFKGKDRPARMAYQRYLHTKPNGRYARDIRVILSYKKLPRLQPFAEEDSVVDRPE